MINFFRQVRAVGAAVGSILFNSTSGGVPSSDSHLYWDGTNHNLGIGVTDVNDQSSTPFNPPNIVEIGPSAGGGAGLQNAVLVFRGNVTGTDSPIASIPFVNTAYSAGVHDRRIAEIRSSRSSGDSSGTVELWTADAGTLSSQLVITPKGTVRYANQPGAYSYQGSGQAISTATLTAVTLDTNSVNRQAVWATGSNTRMTVVAGSGGTGSLWMILGCATFPNNTTGVRGVFIRKNGGTYIGGVRLPTCGGTEVSQVNISVFDVPADGDYYELVVYQTSGGSLTLSTGAGITYMQAYKLH